MTLISSNGWQFGCAITGEGQDLVFIHGEIHGASYWENQIKEFSRDHRCFIYNRRGHNGTGAPSFGYSLENQSRDLEGLIKSFDIQNPILISLAFGTTIAADYAIHHPKEVKGLVLVAWSELHDARLYFDRWLAASEKVAKILEKRGRQALLEYLRQEGGKTVYMVIPPNGPFREKSIQLLGGHPLTEYRQGMLEFATSVPDLITPLSALETPMLGICGAEDPFPDQPEKLSHITNFTEAPFIDNAGRFVQWEKPAEFNSLLRSFILRLS